jgi:hypothetical protein
MEVKDKTTATIRPSPDEGAPLCDQEDCKKTCFYTIMAFNVMGADKG